MHLVLQSSLHIRYLDLSHNEFGEAGGEILGPAVGMHSRLGGGVARKLFLAGDSESLRILNLSWNHLRRKGADAIADGLKVLHNRSRCPGV